MSNSNNSSFDGGGGGGGGNNSNTNSAAEMQSSGSEEIGIEDLLWTLMTRAGLISQFKGDIAKYLQEHGGNILSDTAKMQARANPAILQSVYEYLQWVGMKHTSALLLSESPTSFDITSTEADAEPKLCHLFRESGSPDMSLAFDDEQFASPTPTETKVEPASTASIHDDNDNNTQDVSIAGGGATSDTDSKDLDSCDHIAQL